MSATRTNAALFRMEDRIGTVEEGKDADLILVDGDPLADVGVLVDCAEHPAGDEARHGREGHAVTARLTELVWRWRSRVLRGGGVRCLR